MITKTNNILLHKKLTFNSPRTRAEITQRKASYTEHDMRFKISCLAGKIVA